MAHIKLALLLCDTPVPEVLGRHGTYLDIFRVLLTRSLRNAGVDGAEGPFILDGFDVVSEQAYPDLDAGYSGVLISGSAASAYDDKPWINKLAEWVRKTATSRPELKLIGICFGHQIIARALGGDCVPNGGKWEVGVTDVELTDLGKEIFKADGSSLPIQQMHRDHVPQPPPSFHVLGSSPIAPVQGLLRTYSDSEPLTAPANVHILTVQGHPEFNAEIVNAIIDVRERSGAMNAEVVADGRRRADMPHEGAGLIGRAIWRVLGVIV